MPIQNKLKLYLALVLLLTCVPSIPVYATQTITQDDLDESGIATRNVNVVGEDDGWYSVKIPLSTSLSVTNSRYPVTSKPMGFTYSYIGELPVDKKLIVYPEDTVTLTREGSDDSIECGISGLMFNDVLPTQTYDLDPNIRRVYPHFVVLDELPAGHWEGYITINVEVVDHGITLSADEVLQYVEPDTTVTELTIPKYIDVDGQHILISGIRTNSIANYPNLTKINLEPGRKYFSFVRIMEGNMNPITIDCGGANVSFEQTEFTNTVTLENIGKSYTYGFYARNGLMYLNDLGRFTYYTGTFPETYNETEMVIPSDIRCTSLEYQPISLSHKASTKKLTVPKLKYIYGIYIPFGNDTLEEVYYNNTVVQPGAFRDCTALKKVVLGPNVKVIMEDAFNGCTSLTDVTFEGTTKYIGTTAFYNTAYYNNLKETQSVIYIDGHFMGYGNDYVSDDDLYVIESFTPSEQFYNMVNLDHVPTNVRRIKFAENLYGNIAIFKASHPTIETVDLTGMSLNANALISTYRGEFPSLKTIIIGEEYTRPFNTASNTNYILQLSDTTEYISDFAFNHYTIYEGESLTIPASVKSIGYGKNQNSVLGGNGMTNHVFYDFGKDNQFSEFKVADTPEGGTTYYKAVDGILYTGDMKALVAVPRAKTFEDNKFVLPDGVVNLGELSFSRNKNFTELVLDDDLVIHSDIAELTSATSNYSYDGYSSLNSGNSLSVALYGYTNVDTYTVNETNPNYKSVNGLIYSKDGEHLIAVPHNYSGILEIEEGCKYWDKNALWIYADTISSVNSQITGVIIPSTMEYIDPDQLAYVNRKYSNGTIIIRSGYFRRYSFLLGKNILYTPHFTPEVGDVIDIISDVTAVKHSHYWIDSSTNTIGGMGYNNVYTVAFAPFELPAGKYKVSISIRNVDASPWYLLSRNSNKTGNVEVSSDVTGRDLKYFNDDVITVTDPDNLIHLSLVCTDASQQTGELPDNISITLERTE